MEIVSVKFNEEVLQEIDKKIAKHRFNSRTEFIREAVRDKISELEREELLQRFLSLRGKAKNRTPLDEDQKIKWEVSRELQAELEKRFRHS
ncbi:ribbon-helix-helix domain-containing protein [Candidatus Woesearchaeota archaeon]|nr:ribbon-helix-helix domain-containing protein [Candidatus Woesearchaeota archaeon]